MADDVVAGLDVLGVRAAAVVAHSWAGWWPSACAAASDPISCRCWSSRTCAAVDRERPLPQRPDGVELSFDWDVVPAIVASRG